jgi:hypothetical protein
MPIDSARKLIAHQLGVADATTHFELIRQRAENVFEVYDEQFTYLAGYIAELTRLARQHDRDRQP